MGLWNSTGLASHTHNATKMQPPPRYANLYFMHESRLTLAEKHLYDFDFNLIKTWLNNNDFNLGTMGTPASLIIIKEI